MFLSCLLFTRFVEDVTGLSPGSLWQSSYILLALRIPNCKEWKKGLRKEDPELQNWEQGSKRGVKKKAPGLGFNEAFVCEQYSQGGACLWAIFKGHVTITWIGADMKVMISQARVGQNWRFWAHSQRLSLSSRKKSIKGLILWHFLQRWGESCSREVIYG